MKVLFRTLPAYGHLYPMMPLAESARDAGHEVVFSTAAGEHFDRLGALGYETHAAGATFDEAIAARFGANRPPTTVDGETDWHVIGEMFDECAVRVADDLVPLMGAIAPDLVIYEQTDVGAAVAADAAGVHAVCQAIVRALPPDVHDRMYGTRPHALQRRHGRGPSLDVARSGPVLDSYPPSLQASAWASPQRIALRPVPWSDPTAPLPSWIGRRSRPLVYLTFGTVPGYDDSWTVAVEGLASLDVDVLVVTGPDAPVDLGPLPGNVHAESFVHHARLLPHLDLMIHHGGCGTTTGAWVHGIPQLVWPHGADHFINADVVESAGMGIVVKAPTAELVAMSARELIDEPSYRRVAAAVRDEIAAMPDPADVVARLAVGVHRFV
jgi:UDP:flavonoid glycosyltransferase YjiC (YdhE family)